jgi:hypothetical protein
MFHATNTGHLASTRIKDDEGALVFVDGHAGRRDDTRQAIVDRPFQRASVDQQLGIERQDMGRFAGVLFEEVVAALTQHINKQQRPLKGVDPITRYGIDRRKERHAGWAWGCHCQPPIIDTGKHHARSCGRDTLPQPDRPWKTYAAPRPTSLRRWQPATRNPAASLR